MIEFIHAPTNLALRSSGLRAFTVVLRTRASEAPQMIHHPHQRINLLCAWSQPVSSLAVWT